MYKTFKACLPWNHREPRTIAQSGQTIVEYVMIMGILLAAMGVLSLFLQTFKDFGVRVLELVASDYP